MQSIKAKGKRPDKDAIRVQIALLRLSVWRCTDAAQDLLGRVNAVNDEVRKLLKEMEASEGRQPAEAVTRETERRLK